MPWLSEQAPSAYGKVIKTSVERGSGIPVSVGIAPTKTLSKLANYAAKRWKKMGGVVDLTHHKKAEQLMRVTPVREIWGVGSRVASKLKQQGVENTWQLACMPQEMAQAQFNVVVARTVMELNGISCLPLEQKATDKQQIVCSRSFKQRLITYDELAEALTQYASRAAEKLRAQKSVVGSVTVFIRTGLFNPQEPQYEQSISLSLPSVTQDTRKIIKVTNRLLKQIYRPNYSYQKAGIALGQIKPIDNNIQHDLFTQAGLIENNSEQQRKLMESIDEINLRFPNKLSISTSGMKAKWQHQPEYISQRYTTHWDELATVKCG